MDLSPPQRTSVRSEHQRPVRHASDSVSHVGLSRARRRAVALLLFSVLLPGSAQMLAGNRTVGRIVLRSWLITIGIAAILGVVALLALSTAVEIASSSWFLRIAQWTLLGWAVVWAVVVLDAWRLGRPESQPPQIRRRFALATVILLVLPGSVAYAGASVAAGRAALAEMFAEGPAVAAADGRYNILLLGGDSGAGREGTRPDSLQLLSINARTGRAATFGFTRDTENIRFKPGSVMAGLMPQGWACGSECLLNGLYTWAVDNQDLFPPGVQDPGILATREAVEALSGLDIQYYAMVDLNGFRSLVDAMGGLEINVMRRTPIGGGTSPIYDYIEPGLQRLDGYHALWYARSRTGSSNYERMARQRCVMSAMVDQLDPRSLALRFPHIATASTGVLRTDIPQSELGTFAELAMKTRSQKVTGVNFVPPLLKPWDYDVEEIHQIVEETLKKSDGLDDQEAQTTSAVVLDGAASAVPVEAVPDPLIQIPDQGSVLPPEYDPLDHPSQDEYAQAEDIASVCYVG